jgi:subtilisin family serine protease
MMIGKLVLAVVVGIAPAMVRTTTAAPPSDEDHSTVSEEFVVAASPETAAAAGLTVVGEVGFGWTLVTKSADVETPPDDSAAEIAGETGLEVEPNIEYQLADDPLFPDQWALENSGQTGGSTGADIDIRAAWSFATGDQDTVVAVLDTGAALAHPDLSSRLWVNPGEIAGNGLDDDGNGFVDDVNGWDTLDNDADPSDSHGHGTFVATTAVAALNGVGMVGVAPDSAVMPIRVCQASCTLGAILSGLAYAIANGADVINLSFGLGGQSAFSPLMENAIRSAVDAGITVVAAAGNAGTDNDAVPFYPASYDVDGLISVAANDDNDALAWFSNYGATSVDLAAPGDSVLGGTITGWGTGSGTSFSSPVVAGVAALVRSVRPDLTPPAIAELIIGSVDIVPGLSGRVESDGRLDAGLALEMATAPVAVAKASPSAGVLPYTVQLSGAQSFDPAGDLVSWSWSLPDGSVVNSPLATWAPRKPGTYRSTLTIVDDDGLTDKDEVVFSATLRPGGTFKDDNGHFAQGAVEAIAAEGITNGCNPPVNDRFCPQDAVTRGQMAAFLARALKLPAAQDVFDDDSDSVFEQAINKLAAARITVGCNPPANTRFCPDDPVTRGQMAAFLSRAFALSAGAGFDAFVDDDSSVFENAIDRLWAAGITFGCNPPDNDRYCPDSTVSRGEMAVFLTRALGLTPFHPPPPD